MPLVYCVVLWRLAFLEIPDRLFARFWGFVYVYVDGEMEATQEGTYLRCVTIRGSFTGMGD